MPFLTVRHVTTYHYKQPVAFGEHRVMFRPRDSYDQRLLHSELTITPTPISLHWTLDVFGNCVASARFAGRATSLRFESLIELEHDTPPGLDFAIAEHAELYPFCYDQEDMPDLLRSIERQYPDRENRLTAWAQTFVQPAQRTGQSIRTADLLDRITKTICRDFTYVRREEMGIQPPLETLRLRSGSCRDFALLMMEALRALGLAARFVSGYLFVRPRTTQPAISAHPSPASGATPPSPQGGGSTHAWVQVYVPGAGWMEFDPTNGTAGSHDLVRVAIARDPNQAVPLWGTWTGFPSDNLGLTVDVTVTSSPHPTQRSHPGANPIPTQAKAVSTG